MVDLDGVGVGQLTKIHPERSRWETKWSDYRLLYKGGDEFLRSAGQLVNTRISTTIQQQVTNALTPQAFQGLRNRRFLYQFESEPDPQYFALWNRAYYLNYNSSIIDYFRHWLFSQEPVIRPKDGGVDGTPDWWLDFYENANGSGQDFPDFVRDVFLDVLICRRAGWLIGRNTSVGEIGDGDESVVLTPYPAEQIYDWEKDETGELLWVVLGSTENFRQFPSDRAQVQTYTYLDRDQWRTWQIIKNDPEGKEAELRTVAASAHSLGKVPFVMMEIPEGLWIADKLAMPCTDIFNKQVRLTNAQLMGCIMQPFIRTSESRETAQGRILGENIMLHLRAADTTGGGEEDFGWKSPDTKPLEFIAAQLATQRDEIYRIVHQMALAVDSKAIGAIARSGASKIEDRKASEIILAAFGGYVAAGMLKTANLLSDIQGDDTEWCLDGFDNFNVSSLDEEIQIAALAKTMGFKSKTANIELELKTVGRILDFLPESKKEEIAKETQDAYDQEEEAKLAPPSIPHVVGPDGQPTPAVGAPIGGGAPAPGKNEIVPPKKLGFPDKESK